MKNLCSNRKVACFHKTKKMPAKRKKTHDLKQPTDPLGKRIHM